MGKQAQQRLSALRPGKRERARRKKHRRSKCTMCVGSAGTFSYESGTKKWWRFYNLVKVAIRIQSAGNLLNAKMRSLSGRLPYKDKERPGMRIHIEE